MVRQIAYAEAYDLGSYGDTPSVYVSLKATCKMSGAHIAHVEVAQETNKKDLRKSSTNASTKISSLFP